MADDKGDNTVLKISPEELAFVPSNEKAVPLALTLKNESNVPLGFKVRTTAPKRYMVKPGTGYVMPGTSQEVTVFLTLNKEPMKPAELRLLKDKFQIQEVDLTSLPPGSDAERNEFVKNLWNNPPAQGIRSKKLRCTFILPVDDSIAGQAPEAFVSTPSFSASRTSSLSGSTFATPSGPAPSAPSPAPASTQDEDKAARYRAERDKIKREYDRLLKEKLALEKAAEAPAQQGFVPLIVAFVLGFILAKII